MEEKKEYIDLTITPKELNYMILERRKYFMDSLEEYNLKKFLGASWPTNNIRAYLYSLFDEIYSGMEEDYKSKKSEFEELKRLTDSKEVPDLIKAKRIIDAWLYKKGLLKFDYIDGYDNTNMELSNKKKGF